MQFIYILYDSIDNTVFASQVWQPLIERTKQDQTVSITLISFESKTIKHNFEHPQIKIIQLKRLKYFGTICLLLNLIKIKSYLPKTNFKIIARGPFAGWIANRLLKNKLCLKATIQVRGLIAAEYEYTHPANNFLKKYLVWTRSSQLLRLEKKVYSTYKDKLFFECVSKALKEYLIFEYDTPIRNTFTAKHDTPKKITTQQCQTWRASTRTKLNIPTSAKVYCYSGSTHTWQCPQKTVDFFRAKLDQDQNSFLLILSRQTQKFEQLIKDAQIPTHNYLVLAVDHSEIYQYLAAANFGLIFRDKHLLNWVSRPTKVLEYQSVGLKVIHNKTIEWLSDI
jgi:hypothetical protein